MRGLVRITAPVIALAAVAAMAALQPGCTRSSKSEVPCTVRGRLTFQGQPVVGGTVIFTPDRDRGSSGKPMRADTGPDGVFELRFESNPAIPPGWYRVAIAPPAGDAYAGSSNSPFPPQLRRPDTSTLSREVTTGRDNFFEFAVEVPTSH
jgi:hypothetical protein